MDTEWGNSVRFGSPMTLRTPTPYPLLKSLKNNLNKMNKNLLVSGLIGLLVCVVVMGLSIKNQLERIRPQPIVEIRETTFSVMEEETKCEDFGGDFYILNGSDLFFNSPEDAFRYRIRCMKTEVSEYGFFTVETTTMLFDYRIK